MITIFSAEDNSYQHWQSQLLAYTFSRVQQSGSLVCLLSSKNISFRKKDFPENLEIFPSCLVTVDPVTGDNYAPYNKPAAFCDYFSSRSESNQDYLLLDPDMVFAYGWSPAITPELGIGEETLYMDPTQSCGPRVIARHCRRNLDQVQPIGFPVVIHEQPLREIVDRWYTLTQEMRQDKQTRHEINWVCEMWAFTTACAEAGVRFQVQRNCSFLHDNFSKQLIHYTYPINTPQGFHWDKRHYRPWDFLPPPQDDLPQSGLIFHNIISQYIREREL